jgi:hypothetical protein
VSPEETQGKLHPIRLLWALSVSSDERETSTNVTSCAFKCATEPLKLSVANVQPVQPSGVFGPCMNWYTISCERPSKNYEPDLARALEPPER